MQLRMPQEERPGFFVRHPAKDGMGLRRRLLLKAANGSGEMLERPGEIGFVIRRQETLGSSGQTDSSRHPALQDSPLDQTTEEVSDEPVGLEPEAFIEAVDAAGQMAEVLGERPLALHCAGGGGQLQAVAQDVIGGLKGECAAHLESVAT
jgi:hypothetical protein